MADQTQRLETIGIVRMNETNDEDATDHGVRCPRCGYSADGLTRSEACSRARKRGCPDCVVPTDDLGDGDLLTDVSNPLAITQT